MWVHKKCSDVKGKLMATNVAFVCRKCVRGVQDVAVRIESLDIGNGVVLEKVGKFCYLGDMLNADGGADSAVVARVRSAWKKFRELSPILTSKRISLSLKGKIYASCVRSCLVYGSETWPMKVEHEAKLERTEMRMIRWMCGVSLRERKTNVELRERIGVEPIAVVVRRNRLRWFGHIQRKMDGDWVKGCTMVEVEGTRPRGRPKKSWTDVIQDDMRLLGLVTDDTRDRGRSRRMIWGKPANPGIPG